MNSVLSGEKAGRCGGTLLILWGESEGFVINANVCGWGRGAVSVLWFLADV